MARYSSHLERILRHFHDHPTKKYSSTKLCAKLMANCTNTPNNLRKKTIQRKKLKSRLKRKKTIWWISIRMIRKRRMIWRKIGIRNNMIIVKKPVMKHSLKNSKTCTEWKELFKSVMITNLEKPLMLSSKNKSERPKLKKEKWGR